MGIPPDRDKRYALPPATAKIESEASMIAPTVNPESGELFLVTAVTA